MSTEPTAPASPPAATPAVPPAGPVAAIRFGLAWAWSLIIGVVALPLAPLLGPRRVWALLAHRWGRLGLKLVGVDVTVLNPERLKGPALFLVQHISFVDVLYVPAILPPETTFVVKDELGKIPLWGWAIRAGGAVLLPRDRGELAIAQLNAAVANLPPGQSLVIFPEGTRGYTGALLPFKRGAFHVALAARLPVVVVGAAGPERLMPKGGWILRPGRVTVAVSEPISTEGWTKETLGEHLLACRGVMEAQRRRAEEAAGRVG
ncbi:1-acyl-sn-glycerol-3-phosphate acyltransferase [Myxococcota bacterium]|nr:1-acyl-sn-glycerol-3-phosphate acyltransferase [Myxococcota bacterium]